MEDIKFDSRNYRLHDDKNKRLIKKSLSECGAGRSILLDNDDVIIAGNGVYEQAKDMGIKVRVIESDGTELIAIKRTDLSTEDERRKALALADNHVSDTSEFDYAAIAEDFGKDKLEAWEMELPSWDAPDGPTATPEVGVVEDGYDGSVADTTDIKTGDIFRLGEHLVMCGDSTDSHGVEKLLGGKNRPLPDGSAL